MLKFVHLGLNHSNNVCKSNVLSKLCCTKSTFASNYSYLTSKYNISHITTGLPDGKVRMKFQQNSKNNNEAQTLIDKDLCNLIELISLV